MADDDLITIIDWDGISYCIEGCGRPAVVERLYGATDHAIIVELVCVEHARTDG